MFLTFLIIFDPAGGWSRAAESGRTVARAIFLHLLPLVLLGCVAEGAGMVRWGKRIGDYGAVRHFPMPDVMRYEVCHFALGLGVVFLCALMLKFLSNTFQARQKFAQALTVSVFGLGPVFLMRVFDAFPAVNPWISWAIGAALIAMVLYQGLPRVMSLDPSHALGVYLSGVMLLVLTSGIARMLVVLYLQGKVLGITSAY